MKKLIISAILWLTGLSAAPILNLTELPKQSDHGRYVGYVTGNIDNGASLQAICIDYNRETPVPSSFPVSITSYADAHAPLLYKRLDWLMRNGPASQAELQWTIWNLLNPDTPDYGNSAYYMELLLGLDLSNYSPALSLYDPIDGRNQRFVALAAPVPESGAGWLMAVGLGLAMAAKRRLS